MQLKFLQTIVEAQDDISPISSLAWSPNNTKLAVCNNDNVVILFDENGEKRDKFSTKPQDPKNERNSYIVKGLAFSPDSIKIAVGQSDCIVYVYKIGEEWGSKKSIVNKFPLQAAVTGLIWFHEGFLIAGLSDGQVRSCNTRTNKSKTLYTMNTGVIAIAYNPRGGGFITAAQDGLIVRHMLSGDEVSGLQTIQISLHPVAPYALAWASGCIMAAGCDRRIAVYPESGGPAERHFDFPAKAREPYVAVASPGGQAIAIGGYDLIQIYTFSPREKRWSEGPSKTIENLYIVTSMAWRRDGARLAVGSLCGSIQMIESVVKRTVWKDKFELTHVGPSQVLVQPLDKSKGRGVILRSQRGSEIEDVRILGDDMYLVARTAETLMIGDLARNLLSEIPWVGNDEPKYNFQHSEVALIFRQGELTLVQYGKDEPLYSARTELASPARVSVRLRERRNGFSRLAYLLDPRTIHIVDLESSNGATIAQVSHDSRINWLELNEPATKLLFRDKRLRLILTDCENTDLQRNSPKHTLLTQCTFAQWVVGSDVIVAQTRGAKELCIWYDPDAPDRPSLIPIRGEAINVVREDGKTEVIVQPDASGGRNSETISIQLDENLVEFATALNDHDLPRAVAFLESQVNRPEAQPMWTTLGKAALSQGALRVAQRCSAALGDVARATFLSETLKIAQKYSLETGRPQSECPDTWARLAILEGKLTDAAALYLELGRLNDALGMYRALHRWEDALRLAEYHGYSEVEELRKEYLTWLMNTGQETVAGEYEELQGRYEQAIDLYLKGGTPGKAAKVILSEDYLLKDNTLVNRVISTLERHKLYEQAGKLHESTGRPEQAFKNYRQAAAFSQAIQLARNVSPTEVVRLEEQWGDHLVASGQNDAAINHYIEAGRTVKALDASISAKQWKKAIQIAQVIEDPNIIAKYLPMLGQHLKNVSGDDLNAAQKLYLKAGMPRQAIALQLSSGNFDAAQHLAKKHLDQEETNQLFFEEAQKLQEQGRFKEAEELFIEGASDHEAAIIMYKRNQRYQDMIRLVSKYQSKYLKETLLHLGSELESAGRRKEAEAFYLEAGDWKSAVNMYRSVEQWDEAYRVAQGYDHASHHVALLWARALPIDSAAKLLARLNIAEQVLDLATEAEQFEWAADIAKIIRPDRVADIRFNHALILKEDERYVEAESAFIDGGNPREAIQMHLDVENWESAKKLAEKYSPDELPKILQKQAISFLDKGNLAQFESLLLQAKSPNILIDKFQETGHWAEALRISREYVPSRLTEVQENAQRANASKSSGLIDHARILVDREDYMGAIQTYIQINDRNALMEAFDVANRRLQGTDEFQKIVLMLAPHLESINEYESAANLYGRADLFEKAIESLAAAGQWKKARLLAQDLAPEYFPKIEMLYTEFLRQEGRADVLNDIDATGAALDLLAKQGNWLECLDEARARGPETHHKYVALRSGQLLQQGQPEAVVELYHSQRLRWPVLTQNFNLYRLTSAALLASNANYESLSRLRDLLFSVTEATRVSGEAGTQSHNELERLLLAAHYAATRDACRQAEPQVASISSLIFKLSISLCRHSDLIPADKLYYDAGMEARRAGRDSEAFVFLNHFLDLVEAIEDNRSDMLDSSDLNETGFPLEVPLPDRLSISMDKIEAAKEWVLTVSVDSHVEQTLPLDDRGAYAAALLPGDKSCIVSGWPVFTQNRSGPHRSLTPGPLEFRREGRKANREDWMRLSQAAKHAPDTSLNDVLSFLAEWAGPPSSDV